MRGSVSPCDRSTIVLVKSLRSMPAGIENVQTALPPVKLLDVGRSGLPAILIEHATVPLVTGAPVSVLTQPAAG